MTGNPTTAPEDENNEKVVFNGPGIINSSGQLNVTGGTGCVGSSDSNVVSGDLGGGSGGCGGSSVVFDHGDLRIGDPPYGTPTTWTTSSPGQFKVQDPVPGLEQEIERLKGKLEELEKRDLLPTPKPSSEEQKDIDYFRRNLYKNLKIPNALKDVDLGPNDILVLHIDTSCVPPKHVERFIRKAKDGLMPLWKKVGLEGRILCIAGEHTGFSAIHTQAPLGKQDLAYLRRVHEATGFAEATRTFTPAKKRYPPPVMG